jgi:hypothetical protein
MQLDPKYPMVEVLCTLTDGEGDVIYPTVEYQVHIQDTQEKHTIDGKTYNLSEDMDIGTYRTNNGKTELDDKGKGSWFKDLSSLLPTTSPVNKRHLFTTLFIGKQDPLLPNDSSLREWSGFECRIRWDYKQPVKFVEFNDFSSYATRDFSYYLNVVDNFDKEIPCRLIAKVNGVTVKDENNPTQPLKWDRIIDTFGNYFDIIFSWKYLHAGKNKVELKIVSDYDYEGSYIVEANLPYMSYNISVPTITGEWSEEGMKTIDYYVSTIENDNLPQLEVWDLKLDDETLVARDKVIRDGEWTGEYTNIQGTLVNAFISSSYDKNTGLLRIKFINNKIPSGKHTLKLLLPKTEAIKAGSHSTKINVAMENPLDELINMSKWKYYDFATGNETDVTDAVVDTTNKTINFLNTNIYMFTYASLAQLFDIYSNEFSIIAKKGYNDGRYDLGFAKKEVGTIKWLGYNCTQNGSSKLIVKEKNYSKDTTEVAFKKYNEFHFKKSGSTIIINFCSEGKTYREYTLPITNLDLSKYYLCARGTVTPDLTLTVNKELIDYPYKEGN